jgi:dTDP-4-amino-4,6-dideoxygalactose transaminase
LSQQAKEPFPHYEHIEIGYNYRMSSILAALGRGQLRVLGERVRRKRENFENYSNALEGIPGIELMPEAVYGKSNRWLTVILITSEKFGADRETVRLALEAENIESRPVWKPMHLQPVFQMADRENNLNQSANNRSNQLAGSNIFARSVGGEVAEDLFARGLCLPSGTELTNGDIERVVSVILSCGNTF